MAPSDPREAKGRPQPDGMGGDDQLTPEELIVEIYRQRTALVEEGRSPARVVISARHYRSIREYHQNLGEIAPGKVDYLDPYRVFDLEICLEEIPCPRVEAG